MSYGAKGKLPWGADRHPAGGLHAEKECLHLAAFYRKNSHRA